ncbi:hypothetical protein [Tissierella praeacuta]|uniref:hypothetical protein n=1 Tax=Tissierella praeacuta TaxID=43131 RepID=UPI00334002D8
MLKALLRSFEYDIPRAEICCQIGDYYFSKGDYKRSIFWYKLIFNLEKPVDGWGFVQHDYWGYIPCMKLCLCYDRIGNIEEAIKYNDKAAEYKPNDLAVEHNKNYFENIRK